MSIGSIEPNELISVAQEVKKYGGNLIQIYLTNYQQLKTSLKSISELKKFKKFLCRNKMKVVVHSSYLHNIAREWDHRSFWIKNLELEIKYAHYIGAFGVVIHFGKQLELSKETALNNMFSSIVFIHNKTREYNTVNIILETSAGQGTELCHKMEDLSHFYKKFTKGTSPISKELKLRVKLCVDTCHIFSAGYCLRTITNIKLYLEAFEELIGLKNIALIHLNDCKVECGARKDRHQNIGKGYIGIKGLIYFFKYFKKLNVPIVLETPNLGYKNEINMLLKQ
jgi:deoxyribonuclease-4